MGLYRLSSEESLSHLFYFWEQFIATHLNSPKNAITVNRQVNPSVLECPIIFPKAKSDCGSRKFHKLKFILLALLVKLSQFWWLGLKFSGIFAKKICWVVYVPPLSLEWGVWSSFRNVVDIRSDLERGKLVSVCCFFGSKTTFCR